MKLSQQKCRVLSSQVEFIVSEVEAVPMKPKIMTTLATYDRQQFTGDLIAGMTVAMVALPLSLAIAIASGAGPEKGLVTAIVGGLLISLLGGSRVQIDWRVYRCRFWCHRRARL